MDFSSRRVLVTGACGFLGSHLAERLARRGARTRAMVQRDPRGSGAGLDGSPLPAELELVPCDLRDAERVAACCQGMELIFHLGGLSSVPASYDAPVDTLRVNAEGTLNVLEGARRAGVARVVLASTAQIYGAALADQIDEQHPLQPRSPYAASKIAAETLAGTYGRAWGLGVVSLALFSVYGPRQPEDRLVPSIIRQLLAGPDLQLGNLHPVRDYLYVDDAAEAFLCAALAPQTEGRRFNIAGRERLSVGELARAIAARLGRVLRIQRDPERVRPGAQDADRVVGDCRLAAAALGWAPQVPLDEGLDRCIAWQRARGQALRAPTSDGK